MCESDFCFKKSHELVLAETKHRIHLLFFRESTGASKLSLFQFSLCILGVVGAYSQTRSFSRSSTVLEDLFFPFFYTLICTLKRLIYLCLSTCLLSLWFHMPFSVHVNIHSSWYPASIAYIWVGMENIL